MSRGRSRRNYSHEGAIHDKIFKLFKNKTLARQLMAILLPPEVYRLFDWDTLEIADSESLLAAKGVRADFVIKVRLLKGLSIWLDLILEHKSYLEVMEISCSASCYSRAKLAVS